MHVIVQTVDTMKRKVTAIYENLNQPLKNQMDLLLRKH